MDNQVLSTLDEIDFHEQCDLTSDPQKCTDFCQRGGLIGYTPNEPCAQGHQNWKLGASSRMNDDYVWRCSKCRCTRTTRHGTFFAKSKLTIREILDLMYFWSQKLDSHDNLRRHCGMAGEGTIVDWKNFVRDICCDYFLKHPLQIGGVGHIVEIDEFAWTKRKYNRGRLVTNQWVSGRIDRDTRECFAVLVDQRDAATLLPIIH